MPSNGVHVQPALLACRGEGGEVDGRQPHPAAADTRLGDGGQALGQVPLPRGGHRVGQRAERVGHGEAADKLLGALLEQAVGPPRGVGGDAAAVDGRRGLADAKVAQHQAVHHAHVARGVLEPDPVAGRGRVERVPVRVAAQLRLVVAGAGDPLPRGRGGGPCRDAGIQLVEAAGPQVELGERQAEAGHVIVRVVEAGQQRRTAQVDDPRRRDARQVRGAWRLVVDGGDPPARHGDRGGTRPRRVHGEHMGVD
jgi:hypothetical protein